jgi:hypothetical protein
VGRVEAFVFIERMAPQEETGGINEHDAATEQKQQGAEIRSWIENSKLWKVAERVRKGVSRVMLTGDSSSAHPAVRARLLV